MGRGEPHTGWSWVITGLGGAIGVCESFIKDDMPPGERQLPRLENLAARLLKVYEAYAGKPPRTIEQINATRNFTSREVLDDYPDTQYFERMAREAERHLG